jgi:hypothetical protein
MGQVARIELPSTMVAITPARRSADSSGIDWSVTIHSDGWPGRFTERNHALRAGERSAQRHETAIGDRHALEMVGVPFEGHRLLRLPQAQGEHEPATQRQLLEPGRCDVPGACRENDAIEGRPLRISKAPIRAAHVDPIEPSGSKMLARRQQQVLVDIDRDDVAALADDLCDERRVVAGPGTNLEDALTRLGRELLEHDRRDRRL